MSQLREPAVDRIVSRVLLAGAVAGFAIMLIGMLARVFSGPALANPWERAGVMAMLATPVVRVLVVFLLFLREKDWRYSVVSFGVLLILLLGSMFRIGEH